MYSILCHLTRNKICIQRESFASSAIADISKDRTEKHAERCRALRILHVINQSSPPPRLPSLPEPLLSPLPELSPLSFWLSSPPLSFPLPLLSLPPLLPEPLLSLPL